MNKTLKIILLILVLFIVNYSCKKIKENFAKNKKKRKKNKNRKRKGNTKRKGNRKKNTKRKKKKKKKGKKVKKPRVTQKQKESAIKFLKEKLWFW